MSDQSDGEVDRPDCPVCDTGMYKQGDPNGPWWCDGCEKEYWKEGSKNPSWFGCGVDGEVHNICPETHADWRDYKANYCPSCGVEL